MYKKKLLITGASGLVGSHSIDAFHNDYELHALVHSSPFNNYDNVTYYEVDFSKRELPDILPETIDVIIHLAQSNRMRDFPEHAVDIFNVNVNSTALLLDYGQRAKASHFIYASTGGVYGPSETILREDTPIALPKGPLGYYFSTKYASENLVKSYADSMILSILRPFFIYGRNQKKNMFLPKLLDNIKVGNPITLTGQNGILVNPVHVSDVIKLINACLTSDKSSTINVSGPEILSIREICTALGEHMNKEPIFKHIDARAEHIIANNEIMKNLLKTELTSFKHGLFDLL